MNVKQVLLVEDNADDEVLTVRALKRSNFPIEIVVVRDGLEAIHYLLGDGLSTEPLPRPLPQVVLLDLKLPRLDGLGVLRRLRADARTKLLPVVILSSSDEEQDRMEGYALGGNSYVRKPVDFEQFKHAAEQLGLYWLILNQPPMTRSI